MAIKNSIEQNQNVQPNTELLQTLKSTLPQYFDAQGNFMLEKFESEIKENNIAEARDGYRLGFVGKDYARLLTGQSSETVITPDFEHNTKPENINSGNVFITGDNLEVLRHLQNSYIGKIKMIYIDPPYNTGKEFVYNDKFEFTDDKLKSSLGYGDAEIERLKSIQGKSSHSAWLTFMYPRIKLAQKLLTDDGVIFVSIDDNEQANLKLLLDDIFGENNFVASVIWNTGRKSMAKLIATNHEYCLIYAKTKNKQSADEIKSGEIEDEESLGKLWREKKQGLEPIYQKYEELKKIFGDDYEKISNGLKDFYDSLSDDNHSKAHDHYCLADCNGIYFAGDISQGTGDGGRFDILHPITKKTCKVPNGGWRFNSNNLPEILNKGLIHFGADENTIPCLKRYLQNTEFEVPSSVFYKDARGAKKRLKKLFGNVDVFSYPKDEEIIKKFIRYCVLDGDIVLDFFAGSGTTAHAVMLLNSEDNGKRKYILAQWNEPTNPTSEAYKAGYLSIDQISRDRVIRAAAKIKNDNPLFADTLDLGFKHYRLLEPTINTINKIFEFNPEANKLFEDDMITPFEYAPSGTSGLHTIIQTWLTLDGCTFDVKVDSIDLAKYSAQYVRENAVLYLIDKGFSKDAMKALLNKIGNNEIAVNTLIVYPYSFSFEQMRELKNNLKNNLEQQVTLIERY